MKKSLIMAVMILGIVSVGDIYGPSDSSKNVFKIQSQTGKFDATKRQSGALSKGLSAIGSFFRHPLDTIKNWQQERIQRRNPGFAVNPALSQPKTTGNYQQSTTTNTNTVKNKWYNRLGRKKPTTNSNGLGKTADFVRTSESFSNRTASLLKDMQQ